MPVPGLIKALKTSFAAIGLNFARNGRTYTFKRILMHAVR